jgi:hypothetical protein
MANRKKAFHAAAWAGVGFDVPADWDFAAAEGNFDKGYYRLDDPEQVRLEVRWELTTPPGRIGDLTDRYLALLVKGKQLPDRKSVRRDTRLVQLPEADLETFAWSGPVDVIGMALRCRRCARSILARLIAPRSEAILPLARAVLGSAASYSCAGTRSWAVLDFRFEVPEPYQCRRPSLRAGRLDFDFEHGRDRLRALRAGLAENVLRTKSLDEWAREQCRFGKRDRPESTEREFKGHPAREISLERRSRFSLGRGRPVRALAWHCPESNSLYLAQSLGPADPEAFAESFRCH